MPWSTSLEATAAVLTGAASASTTETEAAEPVFASTFTGMRDLRESNNLQKRINSGIYTISIPDTTLKQSIKLYAGITTISIISKDIQGYKYMDIHGYPGQPAHEGY